MALDEANHRLFVGYRRPPRLQVLNIDATVPVAQIDISGDADDILYDSVSARLYIACREGFIDVIEQSDPNKYERVARIPTAPGARTALWDSIDRHLYLAVPQRGTQPSAIRVYAWPR
jgi:hypothetical protein